MPRYANLSGKSGITSYDIGPGFITIGFRDGRHYVFTYGSAGRACVQHMVELAKAGRGLNSFLNEQGWDKYADTWRMKCSEEEPADAEVQGEGGLRLTG